MVVSICSVNTSSSSRSSAFNLSANVSFGELVLAPDSSGLGRTGHTVVAIFLGFILVFGSLNNLLVLLVFAKFRSLWTPINLVLINISASDMLVCVFGTPLSFASSLYGRWLLGHHGCKWYGFANSLFGIVSLVSLSILSYERYEAVLRVTKPDTSDFSKAWRSVAGSWLYSLVWTLPPFLGWSSYGPEGPGTSCSVQWHQRTASSSSYVACLFVFCLLLPLLLMVYCYGKILLIIKGVTKINLLSAQRRENHILLMVLTMVSCYLLCWMPYGVVSLVATFGRQGVITPITSVVPSVLAKSSTVVNPVIYVLFNNQDSNMLKQVQHCMQDNLRHEDLQYCRILTEFYRFATQKVSQEDGKMAPLTGTKSPIIRAQLILFKTISQPNTPNTLAWDIKHSELEEVALSMSGVLTIKHTGYYFIHSQVTFSKSNEKSTLKQTIWRQTPKAEEQAKKEPEELLVSYCSLSRTETTPDLCTSSQTGVFRLEKGQQLFVNVTDIKFVNTDKCKFGLFKLQDAS